MQLTFGDAEGQRKRTWRKTFLVEMEQVVPWKALLALIEPHYPKHDRPIRQPYRLATILRVRLAQANPRAGQCASGLQG
jgi:transposase, IS5 family